MANKVVAAVRSEIGRLNKEIARRESELSSLREELRRHERVYAMLGWEGRPARRLPRGRKGERRPRKVSGRARRAAAGAGNSILENLPQRFTVADIAKTAPAKGKNPAYARQVAVRWAKRGRTKRVGRGIYQKLKQKRPRPKKIS